MSYGFMVMIKGDYACFTRPELKVERVSYDVPTPGAIEGMLKSVYWKPAMRYVIDKIFVFNPIKFINIRRNEVKDKVSLANIKNQMNGGDKDATIYTSDSVSQRSSMVLKDVLYGVQFHFEMTGIKGDDEHDTQDKHYNIIKRRLTNGQCFRTPCLGVSEFPVSKIELVEAFDIGSISQEIINYGDYDLGYMLYGMKFEDNGIARKDKNGNFKFSDKASAQFYRPHMVNGIIDVSLYTKDIRR